MTLKPMSFGFLKYVPKQIIHFIKKNVKPKSVDGSSFFLKSRTGEHWLSPP
jgi:hypothetical protein